MAATGFDSIAWANAGADAAPSLTTAVPGPRSLAAFEKTQRHQYGSYFQLVNLCPVAFSEGHGVTLIDEDGNRYLDMSCGHVTASLGHGHPLIAEAIYRQALRLTNTRDFPSDVRVQLMERLALITPGDLNVFQFFCAGTEATEAAMRVARQATGKHEFLSFSGEYHGRTMAAIASSVGNRAGGPRPTGYITVPSGFCYRCEFRMTYPSCDIYCLDFAQAAARINGTGGLAGIITEVITNGSGARVYPDGYHQKLRDIADRNGALLIYDEVATSGGRTGKWFAADHYGTVPDALIMGKTIGNGFPITILAIREQYKDVLQETQPSTTHGGQPMACAATLAVLDIIEGERLIEHTATVGEFALARLREIASQHAIIGEARGKGLLLCLEVVRDKASRTPDPKALQAIYRRCLEKGVVTSGGGNVLRISPPMVASKETVARALAIIEEAIEEVEAGR
jgi:4-aminobutyrate aminotransferase-like enzyme